jgi:hypothetical protein
MTDSIAVFPPGFRLLDADANVVAGGSIEFYDAGTTTAKTVYSDKELTVALGSVVYLDAGGYPVNAQGGSTKVQVYVGVQPYKVVIKTSGGTVLATVDNIRGAFDSASLLETLTLIPETRVATLTADTTLTASDVGTLKNCNTTGGAFTVVLPDATALNNGARIGLRMAGTANQLKIISTLGQTIARSGVTSTAFALTRLGEGVWLIADGGNWVEDTYMPPLLSTVGIIAIADILSTPPGSPSPGARYIVGSAPTGAWSSFTQHDIAEANGQGGWFRYTPAADCGWLAYVQDENETYQFQDNAWVVLLRAASDTVAGLIQVATQAEMETATATNRAVTPGRQRHHPAHPKAWLNFDGSGTPTIRRSYGVNSLTDNGVGNWTINLSTAFSGTDYAAIGWARSTSGSAANAICSVVSGGSKTASAMQIMVEGSGGSAMDSTEINVVFFGDL